MLNVPLSTQCEAVTTDTFLLSNALLTLGDLAREMKNKVKEKNTLMLKLTFFSKFQILIVTVFLYSYL